MWDLVTSKTGSVEFGTPEALMLLPVAAACLALGAAIQVTRMVLRPTRTRGSSYPLVGSMTLWFAMTIVLSAGILAAAQPRVVSAAAVFSRGRVDLVLAVDGSASMWVSDLGRSRLEVAVREVLTLQTQGLLQAGDRASLFVFGATAIRKAHLSPNLDRMVEVVGKLGRPTTLTGDAFPWDSDVAGALERIYQSLDAQDRFEAGADRRKWAPARRRDRAIVLFTDGDFTVEGVQPQRIDAALAELRGRGVAVYPIGIGTRRGEELTEILGHLTPGRDYDPSLRGELEGQRTRLSMVALSSLAERTGGKTFTIESLGGSAAGFLREVIESHRNISFQMTSQQQKQDVWRYLVAAAVLVFAAAVLLL
jgi:hypothetical protein